MTPGLLPMSPPPVLAVQPLRLLDQVAQAARQRGAPQPTRAGGVVRRIDDVTPGRPLSTFTGDGTFTVSRMSPRFLMSSPRRISGSRYPRGDSRQVIPEETKAVLNLAASQTHKCPRQLAPADRLAAGDAQRPCAAGCVPYVILPDYWGFTCRGLYLPDSTR
jgi:hypothetical protein